MEILRLMDHSHMLHFMPHGYCFLWLPTLVALHVISDGLIALSYFIIPFALAYFVYKRDDLVYDWMFICFGAFIVSCGTTHILEIWTLWVPDYWLSGTIKAVTAIISFATAILLIKLIPEALKIPSAFMLNDANAALEKSEAKFRNILEGAPDAMVIAGKNGIIEIVNAQTERLFGYSKNEITGKPVEFLIPKRFQEKHVTHREDYFSNPHPRPMGIGLNLFGLRKDGSEFPVEISLSPVETDTGVLALAAIRDITEKKNIENILIEKNMQLVDASQTKDQFLTHMSHELRTPLNGIITMTQLLLTSSLTQEQKEQLNIINESNEQLLAVINSVLDFSKLEANNIVIENVEYNLQDTIHKAVSPYKIKAAEKGIQFIEQLSDELPVHCHGDPTKIRQILSNVLDNAVKFTEKGSVTLTVQFIKMPNGKLNLYFEVNDTGIGISHDIATKLFQPFTQGDSSMTRKYGGTGLGLVISKKLTELLGGEISIEAKEKGCLTYFTLPCVTTDAIVESTKSRKLSESVDSIHLKLPHEETKRTVLLIEDNRLNQKAICLLLKNLDLNVIIANDGLEGLEMLEKMPIDLILMDCQIPNLDGYKTSEAIRKIESKKGSHIPIIGVTAHATEGNRQKCLDAGMDEYISKPYNIYELNKLILKYLEH